MKKFLYTALIAFTAFSASAAASPNSEEILKIFHNSFRYAKNVSWSETGGLLKINFTEDGRKESAYYSSAGEMIALSSTLAVNELPVALQKDLHSRYGRYTITEVYQLEGENSSDYYAVLDNQGTKTVLLAGRKKWTVVKSARL